MTNDTKKTRNIEIPLFYQSSKGWKKAPYAWVTKKLTSEKGLVSSDPLIVKCTPRSVFASKLAYLSYRTGGIDYFRYVHWPQYYSSNELISKGFGLADDCSEDILSETFDAFQGFKDAIDATKMATNYFQRVTRAIPLLTRGRFIDAARTITGRRHIVASNWLEFNFAILPTIGTIQDAIKYGIKDKAVAMRLHHGSQQSIHDSFTENAYGVDLSTTISGTLFGSATRYYTAAWLQRNWDRAAFLRPVPALWDMIPWSFAIDWFIPLGTWFDQMTRINLYASDGCDVSGFELKGTLDVSVQDRFKSRLKVYDVSPDIEGGMLERRVATRVGAQTWDLQGLLDRSGFNLGCRRLSYAFALCNTRMKRSFFGGVL